MTLELLLNTLKNAPDTIDFTDTMAVIDVQYDFTPTAFDNGDTSNAAGENNGSCKLFAFARDLALSEDDTLALFGSYYRDDVLGNPDGSDHQNIRNFMRYGWRGVHFHGQALTPKSA